MADTVLRNPQAFELTPDREAALLTAVREAVQLTAIRDATVVS
jgi:hypothetical protein